MTKKRYYTFTVTGDTNSYLVREKHGQTEETQPRVVWRLFLNVSNSYSVKREKGVYDPPKEFFLGVPSPISQTNERNYINIKDFDIGFSHRLRIRNHPVTATTRRTVRKDTWVIFTKTRELKYLWIHHQNTSSATRPRVRHIIPVLIIVRSELPDLSRVLK